jgi:uncharacterized protein YndB with AHSA1/START domain
MTTINDSATKIGERTLVIKRTFDAPREMVWKAWTEPARVMRWWGPKDFTTPVSKIDFRVSGRYLNCMRSPEGKDYWSTGVYQEIIPLKKIICTDSFADEEGNVVSASFYSMSPDFPLEMLITVTLEDDKNLTKLTLKHEGFPPGEDFKGAQTSWNESFDKLAEYLK